MREREREKERERNTSVWGTHQLVASCKPPTRDVSCNPGMSSDWELNQQPFSSQAGTQTTETHQQGSKVIFIVCVLKYPLKNCIYVLYGIPIIFSISSAVQENLYRSLLYFKRGIFHANKLIWAMCKCLVFIIWSHIAYYTNALQYVYLNSYLHLHFTLQF